MSPVTRSQAQLGNVPLVPPLALTQHRRRRPGPNHQPPRSPIRRERQRAPLRFRLLRSLPMIASGGLLGLVAAAVASFAGNNVPVPIPITIQKPPMQRICELHIKLHALNPAGGMSSFFALLGLDPSVSPFAVVESCIPGNAAHRTARTMIMAAGAAMLQKGGDMGNLLAQVAALLLDDQVRTVYLRDVLALLVPGILRGAPTLMQVIEGQCGL